MKLNLRKKISIALLLLIIILLTIIKIWNPEILLASPMYRVREIYSILILSSLLTILLLMIIENKLDFFSVFNIMWIFPCLIFINSFTFNSYDFEKLDYLFSANVEDFELENYKEGGWTVSRIKVENDTIYFSQNPSFDEVYTGKYKVYKSRFTNHFHLTKE